MYDIFCVITELKCLLQPGEKNMQLELIWITVDVSYRDRN